MAGAGSALLLAALLGDLLSPGPLAKPHENLEGLKNCGQCHEAGQQVSAKKCLDCHKELRARIDAHAGFHGKLKDATCNACHHEHQGTDFALVEWPQGKKAFDHASVGWPLRGKHAAADCEKCHLSAAKTYLGAKTSCAACHFDEHRGQLSSDCARCHDERGWKPAPLFSHAAADFALRGAHARVDCAKCHAHEADAARKEFSRFKPVAHARCTDCHQDAHQGRFGADCERCHVEESWTALKTATIERAFHEKTRYPLRGAHAEVACRDCHGPFPGRKVVYKGLAFEACTSCHRDAHQGQLAQPACERCHDVNGFRPARFEVKDHAATRYPLQGSHAAVACALCHLRESKPAARLVSRVLFHPESGRCESCHRDPHAGQLQRACAACHDVATFHAPRLDHDKDTRFALAGAHRRAACTSCHVADATGVVRYRPLQASCASCHADAHAGQFGTPADCARCHTAEKFTETLFAHAPPFTLFTLDGKHRGVACAKCHAEVATTAGRKLRRYRGTPASCEGCHADFHKGEFAGFAP